MNRIFTISLAMVALAFTASAQVGPITINISTNRVPASYTNSAAGTGFFVGNQQTVNVLLSCYSTNTVAIGAGDAAATLTLRLAGSFDNVTYFENGTNWDVVYVTAQTNLTSSYRQIDSSGVQYFRQNKLMMTHTNVNFTVNASATYWYK